MARLLDGIDCFPFGLPFGFRGGAGDIDGNQGFDFRMQMHWDFVQSKRFDRRFQDDLIAVGIEAASGDRGGDVARRNRAVEMARLASLADDDEDLPGEFFGDAGRFVPRFRDCAFRAGRADFRNGLLLASVARRALPPGSRKLRA